MKTYTEEQKKEIINRYLNGESISSLSKSSGISRSTIYLWIDELTKTSKLCKDMNLRDIHHLKVKSERQEKMLEIIRISNCSSSSPQIEKYNAIIALSDRYNVNTLCEALGVAKGSYYNHILRNKKENTLKAQRHAELKPVIEMIFNESRQIFGPGKIAAVMKTQGYKISESTVAKIMHENGWFSIRRSAKTLYLQEQQRKQNILNQEFHATRPNEIWISDITYFSVKEKIITFVSSWTYLQEKSLRAKCLIKTQLNLQKQLSIWRMKIENQMIYFYFIVIKDATIHQKVL